MEEVRETAMTYYANLPQSHKDEATNFFESLDSDGDGKINVEEFMAWVKKRGFKSITRSERLFKELDKDENGTLDFDELFSREITRVKCFNAGTRSAGGSCDLCCSCYRDNNFNHRDDHTTFVDNYALLLSIWRQDKPSVEVEVDFDLVNALFNCCCSN
ncbi:Calcium-binding EF-hand [Corchorus olitorius]|uniref:Calcium-binding EF-hand n=1 Tax=Corchorus olitorius TaxID=93759 RepID=A0A1R3JKS1_9ROSI|nr:Calcium-binding EF-hand [Corchorus olitorius]